MVAETTLKHGIMPDSMGWVYSGTQADYPTADIFAAALCQEGYEATVDQVRGGYARWCPRTDCTSEFDKHFHEAKQSRGAFALWMWEVAG